MVKEILVCLVNLVASWEVLGSFGRFFCSSSSALEKMSLEETAATLAFSCVVLVSFSFALALLAAELLAAAEEVVECPVASELLEVGILGRSVMWMVDQVV